MQGLVTAVQGRNLNEVDARRDRHGDQQPVGVRTHNGSLAPGGVVGDGRYRLLAQLGVDERGQAHLWRARDGQLRRDVALTVLVGDPRDTTATRQARRTLERAAHAAKFQHPQVARVLDVLTLGNGITAGEGLLGIVVSEWGKGTDLIDVVEDGPLSASAACRMIEPLVDAVEQAHHHGLVLGLDHPQRIRRGPDGTLRLAFPGPLPDTSLRDDIKALGAILYVLLTGRWPLPGGPRALPAAPTAPDGRVVAPRSLQPKVPAELSSLAVRTLSDGGDGGVRTSAAFQRVLDKVARREEHEAAVRRGAAEPDVVEDADGGVWTTKRPDSDSRRRRKVAIGATALVAASVAIIAWIGLSLISVFQGDDATGPELNVAADSSRKSEEAKKKQTTKKPEPKTVGKAVKPGQMTLLQPPGGAGDQPALAPLVIDGKADTPWRTDWYNQQFPGLKPGVGLTATFQEPIDLSRVEIEGGTEKTKVEIRTSDQGFPQIDNTKHLKTATLKDGKTTINLDKPAKSQYVVVWIKELGRINGQFQSEIGEINFYPTARE